MATASPRRDARHFAENVIKQGYLKKSVMSSELITSTTQQIKTNIKQKLEPLRWYVFGVRDRKPYLEYFDREESVFTGRAIETYDLSTFERLSYTMGSSMAVYTFCIYLTDRIIEMTAANRAQMIEWCRTLERHLANLGFRVKRGGKEDHTYSEFPVKREVRKTGLEAERLMEEQAALGFGYRADVEEEENEYEDIPDRKPATKDENDNDTLPKVPERPSKMNKKKDDDIVFASLYSVSRDTLDPPYHAFSDMQEEEDSATCDIFESFTEGEDADTLKKDGDKIDTKGFYAHKIVEEESDDDTVCRSLPILPLEGTTSSGDTSEDTDFLGASFWLRNRKTEDLILFDEEDPLVAKRKLPPQPSKVPPVPRRLESTKRNQRMCVSMNEAMLKKSDYKRSRSPTLELLGEAPNPIPEKILTNSSPELPKRIVTGKGKKSINTESFNLYEDVKVKSVKRMDRTLSDDLDKDTIGDYEGPPGKIQNDLTDRNDDKVYESAWMGKSHSDNSPHKKNEKLSVEIPKDAVDDCKKNVDTHKGNTEGNVRPKKKLSFKFSRKSKSRDLPMELSVSAISRTSSTEEDTDINIYSDFPGESVSRLPDAANSDLCKLSLENGYSHSPETSPQLPRRIKMSHSSRSPELPLKGQRSPSDIGTVNYHPDPPSPPRKQGSKHSAAIDLMVKQDREVPLAPPRRNRKTESEMSYSVSGGKHKTLINTFSKSTVGNSNMFQCKRDLPPEPPLPLRDEKPDLPPPRKGAAGRFDIVNYRPDIPARGSRPKSVQITKRQFSVEGAGLTMMNLKQNQVDILRSEIEMANGMKKTVSKVQFQVGLALVENFERVWIAGWDLKSFPRLYDKFHIGDQVIAINDVHITEVSFAMKMVKNIKVDTIEVTVKRLPLAKVYALQREAEGQNLGFKRDGGTAEIAYVDPHGVAARHGLEPKANTTDFICNWWLTEINMRPLNLFFKDNEIEHRLLAVGKDISIVVQPSDFIKELRKQLKKLKGYKDYLVQ